MKLGFTGTRKGMTEHQAREVQKLVITLGDEFHHGDCIGADEEAVGIIAPFAAMRGTKIIGHPPNHNRHRAHVGVGTMLPPKPYLDRNHDIVDATELLIACPKSEKEEWRSGTWATVRYARKQGKRVIVIVP